MMCITSSIALLGPGYFVYIQANPIYYFIKPFFNDADSNYFLLSFRILYITFISFDTARFACIVFVLALVHARVSIKCLKGIHTFSLMHENQLSLSVRRISSFQEYQTLRIIMRSSDYLIDATALFFMMGGALTIITSIFTSVKLYGVIPMPFFMFFPFVSVLCPLFGIMAINQAAKFLELSVRLIHYWKSSHSSSISLLSKKIVISQYWLRKHRSLPPLAYNVGVNDYVFCKIKKSLSTRFW